MMTIIARLFRKTNRRRVMSGRGELCSLVQRLTILNHVTLPHDRCRTQMLKAITIATYNAAAGSRSRSGSNSTSHVLRFLSLHAVIIHFYVSLLSSFALTRNFLVSPRFLSFFISFNLESLLLHDVKSQSQLTFINF